MPDSVSTQICEACKTISLRLRPSGIGSYLVEVAATEGLDDHLDDVDREIEVALLLKQLAETSKSDRTDDRLGANLVLAILKIFAIAINEAFFELALLHHSLRDTRAFLRVSELSYPITSVKGMHQER